MDEGHTPSDTNQLFVPHCALNSSPRLPFANVFSNGTRADVREHFFHWWGLLHSAFRLLRCEAIFFMAPPVPFARPLAFWFGHTSVVCMQKLIGRGLLKDEEVPTKFQKLKEIFGLQGPEQDFTAREDSFPPIPEVEAFREWVLSVAVKILDEMPHPCDRAVDDTTPHWGLLMGIEHMHMAFEVIIGIIRSMDPIYLISRAEAEAIGWRFVLPNPCCDVVDANLSNGQLHAAPVEWVDIAEGETQVPNAVPIPPAETLLANPDPEWDERLGNRKDAFRASPPHNPSRVVHVPSFSTVATLVSNAEFYHFCVTTGADPPPFWVRNEQPGHDSGGDITEIYLLRIAYTTVSMQWDWPVEVHVHQARAYLAWRHRLDQDATEIAHRCAPSLPTEAQRKRLLQILEQNTTPISSTPTHTPSQGNVWEWVHDDDPTVPPDSFIAIGGAWSTARDPVTSARYSAHRFGREPLGMVAGFRCISVHDNAIV